MTGVWMWDDYPGVVGEENAIFAKEGISMFNGGLCECCDVDIKEEGLGGEERRPGVSEG